MKVDIITIFPKMFTGPFDESIIKRAVDKKLVKINLHNLRDYAIDERGTVDDRPFGGGVGMVLRPEPIFSAVSHIKKQSLTTYNLQPTTILLSASGTPYTQQKAVQLSKLNHLILICGHYEGVDQRVIDHLIDEEISIGDYVLTGGEIPAMVLTDSIVRLLPGVLEKTDATKLESFSENLEFTPIKSEFRISDLGFRASKRLEHPHYTRPQDFQGHKVPKILLSGNHKEIEIWRQEKSLEKTKKFRPDLLKKES